MKLSLGFSTCPNDTFIFDAAIHHRIDTEGIDFELIMEDVEELNRRAFRGELDITKLSYHAFGHLTHNYRLASAGSALGRNNGPVIISKRHINQADIPKMRIGIPGKYTTANLLLGIAFPDAQNKFEYLFSDIEQALLNDEIDLGLIIHENRFTYESRGLQKIIDLGEHWEQTTGMPIPLGGIVVNRRLPDDIAQKTDRIIRKSLEYAYQNPNAGLPFIKKYAQEMDENVMQKHILLYVNEFSLNLGDSGKSAVKFLLKTAERKGLICNVREDIFVS